jgi:hypothetical protein
MSVRLIGGDVVSIGNSSVFKKSPRSSKFSRLKKEMKPLKVSEIGQRRKAV